PASNLWRRECLKHLRKLVRFCEKNYGRRMLGYHPCGQHTGEWFYLRSWEPRLSGFSPAMNGGFRHWLKKRYETDATLRKAWGNQRVTLDNAAVPSAQQRRNTTLGLFRDPHAERQLLDFYEYKQLAMEEPLEDMARVIKEETGGNKIVTFFYGYFFDMCGIPSGPQISGHFAMQRMLKCPHVDILCSPISYFDRGSGGCGPFMTAVDSVSAAGKLWLNEDDTRTYLTPSDAGFGRVNIPKETLWIHDRNYGNILPRRMACWYMDLGGTGWLDGQDIWDNIRQLKHHYETSLAAPATFSPEVAVIVDERSAMALACKSTIMRPQVYLLRKRLYRLGAPIRIHYLDDLIAGKIPPCKAYIFLNPFMLDKQTRSAIAKATKGKTAVYFYGSGCLGEKLNDKLMGELIGMQVSRIESPSAQTTYLKDENPLLAGLPGGVFGSKSKLTPLWAIDKGEDITPLATLPDGHPIVAARRSDDGLRVYIGTTDAPAAFLRNILKASGIHLYIDSNDVINADKNFLAITATTAGKKQISLPESKTVRDLHDNAILTTNTTSLEILMANGETRLLLLEEDGK
ncbi:MAG: beta-galactosidase, partial [Pirellulales bacterium]|nr:beta-galactosidase [Pirellulales bacterium]